MATKQRGPAHYLHAIALLAYLAADDDGPITVADDPDEARRGQRETLLGIRDDADRAEPDLHESEARSALALVSAAIDLLDAAEVDAADVKAPDVKAPDVGRRIRKAARHLAEVVEALGAVARIEAPETEVARLRVPVDVARIKAATAAPQADLPVGTITVYAPLGMVRVRLPDGWDLAVGSFGLCGDVYSVAPSPGLEPGPDEDVVRLGDGTVPDSWLTSHAEVAEIARAWLADRGHSLPEPPAYEPPATLADPDATAPEPPAEAPVERDIHDIRGDWSPLDGRF